MRLRLPSRISWRLLLAILPLVAVGISGVLWLQYSLTRRQILPGIEKEIHVAAERGARGLDDLLRQRLGDLFTLSESPLITDYSHNVDYGLLDEAETYRRELEQHLLHFSQRSKVYARILFLDRAGREVCRVEGDRALRPAASAVSPFFAEARRLRGEAWRVSPIEALPDGAPVVHYLKAAHDDAGAFAGALVLSYDLSQIAAILKDTKVGRTGRAFLRTPGGTFPSSAAPAPAGTRLLSGEAALKELPWSLVVEAPLGEFLDPLRRIRDAAVLTALLGIAALLAVLLWLVRSITRPVAALAEAARRIGGGDLSHRIERVGDDELGALSLAFNDMAGSLEANRRLNSHLQGQLVQAEKLSAVGLLVSSVAHELNNPLAAVCGYAQMSLWDDCPPGLREDLRRVHQNALRCRKVVDNLLFFVRQSRREKARVDLNRAAASALELLEYRLAKTEDVAVSRQLDPGLPDALGDFQQLVQVLVNLVNNACDAMARGPRRAEGKRLTLRTWASDGRVLLSLRDNGPGIPEDARARIFEPFFTTKEPGRGTGLGLSICRQILQEHGGGISFSSRDGEGAEFTVSLPVPAESELTALETPPAPAELPAVPGTRVLVADDEKDLAELVSRLLAEDGCVVETAVQGAEALRMARENPYDLVVCDFEMENAKGDEVFAALAAKPAGRRPRILFVTGDILNPKVLGFLEETKADYLTKPFDLGELRQAVRRLLSLPPC